MAVAMSEDASQPPSAAPAKRAARQDGEPRQAPPEPNPAQEPPRRPFRLLWLAAGWIFFAIGFIGIALPVLPTTGFWILAAIAFERSNPKIAARIRNWPRFGRAVSDFLDHGVITRRGKSVALGAMALSAGIMSLALPGPALWAGLGGLSIGALYVATRPSAPRDDAG